MTKTFLALIVGMVIAAGSLQAAPSAPGTGPFSNKKTPADEKVAPSEPGENTRPRETSGESESRAEKQTIRMSTGEDRTIDMAFDTTGKDAIAIGNPSIVATTAIKIGEDSQIVFKPLKAGETTVTVRDSTGDIRVIFKVIVTPTNLLRVKNELMDLLRDIEGLEIRIVGQKVVIDGEVIIPNDFGKLLTVIQDKVYSDLVINLATFSPLSLQVLSKKIQAEINDFAPNVRARVVNGMIFLEGTVESIDTANRAFRLANLYFPELTPGSQLERDPTVQRPSDRRQRVYNFIIVNAPPPRKQEKLVRINVHFVELKKDYEKIFGFSWKPMYENDPAKNSLSVGPNQSGQGVSLSSAIFNLFPKLQNASSAGYARILKVGTLIVRSGQPANFEESTQIPTQQVAANGQIIASKEDVGLFVAVTPLILGQSEDIQLDLKMNQKNVVSKTSDGGVITASHKVETKIYVRSTESAAVAGFKGEAVSTVFNRDSPEKVEESSTQSALFNLTRSKNYRKDKSQFVIFVTPQIIENASDGTDDLKKNFRVKVK